MNCPVVTRSSHGSQNPEPYTAVRQSHKTELMKQYPKGSSSPAGYVSWFDWAEAQHLHGLRQEQCKSCKLWFYPQERAAPQPDERP